MEILICPKTVFVYVHPYGDILIDIDTARLQGKG